MSRIMGCRHFCLASMRALRAQVRGQPMAIRASNVTFFYLSLNFAQRITAARCIRDVETFLYTLAVIKFKDDWLAIATIHTRMFIQVIEKERVEICARELLMDARPLYVNIPILLVVIA